MALEFLKNVLLTSALLKVIQLRIKDYKINISYDSAVFKENFCEFNNDNSNTAKLKA